MEVKMKGNKKLIGTLNALLADELTAVNQYMVHSEMSANWGYEKLHKHFEKRAIDEMKHAEKLIGRILFLEGLPVVSIKLAGELADFATREILEGILKDEDAHIDKIEELQDQIIQMGAAIFLTTQVG
jgi:bacterioferritin